ncbi:hypothetical protein BV25DRAFT_1891581 [Artomyces pyxidatus]|uniref:Uncharacterized protein n=1 Tax=Artomyces pyxidatus TaxID=48021 RepID=A0ACB8SRA8_9AGAM|nr:hypothetical protein BV25DRAFT_1891581 [Artomyces pyxidatus]
MSSSRRSSSSSQSSQAGPSAPLISPHSELILVQDEEEEDATRNEAFDFSSDDDLADDLDTQSERLKASAIPPLSPTLVFLYLLTPFLKLGPMLVPTSDTPLSHSIPALVVFSLLAAASRQLLYMLSKYVHKTDLEEVVLDTFARGGGKERTRQMLRWTMRLGTGTVRVLLATVYLRQSVDVVLPYIPTKWSFPSRIVLTVVYALFILPLYLAPSLGARRLVYGTWASLLAYFLWFGAVSFAHAKGALVANPDWPHMGALWQGITTIAFIFATSWTLPLYAALRGTPQPGSPKRPRRSSFKVLSVVSVLVAIGLTVPLCIFAASPNVPVSAYPWLCFQIGADSYKRGMQVIPEGSHSVLIAVSNAINLLLTIPAILITTPSLPVPLAIRRATNLPISKAVLYIITVALSLLPEAASAAFGNILLVLTLASTYVLPAVIHITIHNFKRPLAIVLPTPSGSPNTPRAEGLTGEALADELLQRKERTLQRRRLGRRLVWDVLAWIMAIPIGAGGLAWTIGKLARKW